MSMGELEFSGIYNNNWVEANIFTLTVYMGFIFMILMVLMNLLNGLAVSDVNKIAEMAEIDSAMTHLQMIAETDALHSLFMGPQGRANYWEVSVDTIQLKHTSFSILNDLYLRLKFSTKNLFNRENRRIILSKLVRPNV